METHFGNELQKILHVESDEDISFIVHMALVQFAGFDMMQCLNGQDALRFAPAFRPQMLLIDYVNSGEFGEVIWNQLRRLDGFDTLPVVFLTGHIDTESIARFSDAGVLGVISKPFSPFQLPNDLRRFWVDHCQQRCDHADSLPLVRDGPEHHVEGRTKRRLFDIWTRRPHPRSR